MPSPRKQLILNAFAMQAPGHLNPGLFKYPKDKGRLYNDIKQWQEVARKLEAAKFHAIFFADVLGGYDVYKGPANLNPTIPAASQFPINDPLYSIPAMYVPCALDSCIYMPVLAWNVLNNRMLTHITGPPRLRASALALQHQLPTKRPMPWHASSPRLIN